MVKIAADLRKKIILRIKPYFTIPVHLCANIELTEFPMLICRLAALTLAAAVSLNAASAGEDGILVIMNQARIVKLSRAADTVVVGNPAIADAAIQDATTVVLTGKGFGTTNFVVMDAEGNAIVDELVLVSRSDANTMRLYRGSDNVDTLSCTPFCERSYRSEAEIASDQGIITSAP
jgi:Flp pilus assembly secretin CpaC